ncbi:MAG TPA: LysR substrate-binding domain-containing protein [Burkholderiaceae bacterium]|nr:LysR substrate-binding domain-containing protein [Burkholderiaceae bacterium]
MLANLRHLRAFREVAAQRSISQAAARVFLSQPAITQAIAKLERSLKSRLFERHSEGMRPTQAGLLYAERVDRALNLIRSGVQDALRVGMQKGSRTRGAFDQLLTITQLRALVAVSNAGNFTLAAQAIGTSQPALYRAARELEALLGIRLYEKNAQGIDLSRQGQILAQQVKLAFAELAQGFVEVAALQGQQTGRIVVGAMPLSRHFLLPAAINDFSRRCPEVEVHAVEGPYEELLRGLRHGEIDLLIGALREPLPVEDILQERLFDDPLTIVARAGHPLQSRNKISIRELAAYPWVVPRRGTPTRDHFEGLFRDFRPPRALGLVESSSFALIRALLLQSDRLTMISAHQVRLEATQGLLTTLRYDVGDTRRPIGLTTRRSWRPAPTQRLFLDLLKSAAGNYSEIK